MEREDFGLERRECIGQRRVRVRERVPGNVCSSTQDDGDAANNSAVSDRWRSERGTRSAPGCGQQLDRRLLQHAHEQQPRGQPDRQTEEQDALEVVRGQARQVERLKIRKVRRHAADHERRERQA